MDNTANPKEAAKKLVTQLQAFNLAASPSPAPQSNTTQSSTSTLSSSKQELPSYEVYYRFNTARDGADANVLTAFDKRVAALEKIIGPANQATVSYPDIQSGLRNVHRKIESLNEATSNLNNTTTTNVKIEGIAKKMKSITAELETLELSRARANTKPGTQNNSNSTPTEDKIEAIYTLMNRWDNLSIELPILVSRFQTLRLVHEEGGTATTRLANNEKQVDVVSKGNNELKYNFNKLAEQISQKINSSDAKIGNIQTLLGNIATKVQSLQLKPK